MTFIKLPFVIKIFVLSIFDWPFYTASAIYAKYIMVNYQCYFYYRWYTKDENMVPISYVLSSISTHLPDFICNDNERRIPAKSQWWQECEDMQKALDVTASRVFGKDNARKYIMSGTALLIEGLLSIRLENI